MKEPIIISEYDTLYEEGARGFSDSDKMLKRKPFENLWNYILYEKRNDEIDEVFKVFQSSGKKRYIKAQKYVGTIQTKDGTIIEILPKIYRNAGNEEEDKKKCRRIFLKMLSTMCNAEGKSFQSASLATQQNFPILEVYISNYISEVENIYSTGLGKNYNKVVANEKFLKGRLMVQDNIRKNVIDRTHFFVSYNKFIENIPQNRILVTTLYRLLNITSKSSNRARITSLLGILSDIPQSDNIESDLASCEGNNRIFAKYDKVISWSKELLMGKGFTAFSGKFVNQALLFSVEKLFEEFIAHLFKKYLTDKKVSPQDTEYFLVDKHIGKGKFRLKPDILVETSKGDDSEYRCTILDTKWKNIDATLPNSDYLIDMKDMYQLYAYGKKYGDNISMKQRMEVVPNLVLIYPCTSKFNVALSPFEYDSMVNKYGLKLMVVPFDLSEPSTYEAQIRSMIKCSETHGDRQPVYEFKPFAPSLAAEVPSAEKKSLLVGCYKDDKHLEWILEKRFYNVRFGKRVGAVTSTQVLLNPTRLLLYDFNDRNNIKLFSINNSGVVYARHDTMDEKEYPFDTLGKEYILYQIISEMEAPELNIDNLIEKYGKSLSPGSPFFITYEHEIEEIL
jgi:5-methylcytosine-specific restriction enzyme subunit McrC